MTDIHILPVGLDAASLSRTCKALERHLEAGHDLGDRSHHIRMLHASLEASHRDLRHKIEAFRAQPPLPALEMEPLFRSVEAWVEALATITAVIEQVWPMTENGELCADDLDHGAIVLVEVRQEL